MGGGEKSVIALAGLLLKHVLGKMKVMPHSNPSRDGGRGKEAFYPIYKVSQPEVLFMELLKDPSEANKELLGHLKRVACYFLNPATRESV